MSCVRVVFPWEFLVPDNGGKRRVSKGRIFNSTKYNEAKASASMLAFKAAYEQSPALLDDPFEITMNFWVKDRRKRDLTNLFKLIMDSMTGSIYTDDKWAYDGHWHHRGIDRKNPRVEIEVCSGK